MVNDRHEHYDEDDESEYQFSDDQINYELEPETKPTAATPITRRNFFAKLTPYRRMIIGVIGFVVVLFIVYKVLAPGATTPPTDFNPNSAATPMAANPSAAAQPVVPASKLSEVAPPVPSMGTAIPTPPAAPQAPSMPTATLPASVPQATVMPPAPAPSPSQQVIANQLAQPTTPLPPQIPQSPAQAVQQPIGQPMPVNQPPTSMGMQTPPPVPSVEQSTDLANKISGLEAQNTNMMNTIQTQFSQKMTEYELQNKILQEKVIILNKRLANMEATLNKMAQIVREGDTKSTTRVVVAPPPPKVIEPKMIYTVQAIIPGRAWLKSDAGDTVTVAEGDILKDYGKIIKIDPYDGVVQIDNGRRIISLSYGTNGD